MERYIMNLIRFAVITMLSGSAALYSYQELIQLHAGITRGSADTALIQQYAQDKAVVLFYKPGCQYCVYLDDKFKALARQNINNAQFIMINIQQNDRHYKTAYGFSTVPTVVYFKKGTIVARHGSNNKNMNIHDMQKNVNRLI